MALENYQNITQLLRSARAMPLASPPDPEFNLSSLGFAREDWGQGAPMPASLAHVRSYMTHLSEALPRTLNALANPMHWKIERLLDPATMRLRRPQICLQARITEHDTLYVSWELAATVPFEYGSGTPKDLREASDFNTYGTTWPYTDARGDTIIRLTAKEHPASRHFGPGDNEKFLNAEEGQRKAFQAFLAAMVGALRAVLDVDIEDWVEYDERSRLRVISVEERALRLAKEQHAAAVVALTAATQRYAETLSRAGTSADEFERVIGGETFLRLKDSFTAVTGRKLHALQLEACLRAYRALEEPTRHEALCQTALSEALAMN